MEMETQLSWIKDTDVGERQIVEGLSEGQSKDGRPSVYILYICICIMYICVHMYRVVIVI